MIFKMITKNSERLYLWIRAPANVRICIYCICMCVQGDILWWVRGGAGFPLINETQAENRTSSMRHSFRTYTTKRRKHHEFFVCESIYVKSETWSFLLLLKTLWWFDSMFISLTTSIDSIDLGLYNVATLSWYDKRYFLWYYRSN